METIITAVIILFLIILISGGLKRNQNDIGNSSNYNNKNNNDYNDFDRFGNPFD